MATSSWTDVLTVRRSQWYFGQYEFCVSGILKDCFVLRYRDHHSVDEMIERRLEWCRRQSPQPGSWRWIDTPITDEQIQNLHGALDWILARKDSTRITVCGDQIYFYCQDLESAREASHMSGLYAPKITRVRTQGTPGKVNLRTSSWLYRTYLRCRRLTPAQKTSLGNLLTAQSAIRLGPALQRWLGDSTNLRSQDHYFIDHSNMGIQTFIALTVDGLIRNTLPINTY